ncbi:phage major capsid protein [Mycobacterium avium subsp. hominissuis]|uniref:Phage major capsid protein n=2 Tax=Mycobacterium avium TaxID=1764 RepID=A0A2A2ZCZ5_MYCAV|nr:phage major capsid protein [Mycobacterium avium]MCA4732920.1 phage major capsid protein [Mycobacterium avium subsp. hominissuis]MCA4741372.1 phage major capsid protein [Mycobacterium avium subsp. hominissuis]MCA4746191.1 phage major capsid protein [Mycobacterium avium subsp. hominissuis]PBA24240.1 phage major capsid protein [Mycobacterium avium]PBA39357.1 phage major capsid protein [Mycobacterium avium]
MVNITTPTSPKAFALDVLGLAPEQTIPQSVLITCTSKAGEVEGDEPAVRVPAVNLDDSTGFVPEGDDINEADPDLSELVILTGKVAVLVRLSREQLAQPAALDVISAEIKRSMLAKVDWAFLQQPSPVAPETHPPGGLLAYATAAGTVADNLDAVIDAVAAIEALPAGQVTNIVASPDSWAALSKLKQADTSNMSLIGAGTESPTKTLLSIPVTVTSAMPANKILLVDRNKTLSAYGQLLVARSDDYYFGSDNVAMRATFRFGAGFVDRKAGQILTVGA